jgi:2,5-diketo-D-gluconate reductase A
MPHHLRELLASCRELPIVTLVELSPFRQQRELRDRCVARGIVVAAYSPPTKGVSRGHPEVVKVATGIARTPAQVLIRWQLQRGLVALPKSTRPTRLAENHAGLELVLDDRDMAALDGLEGGLATGWAPAACARSAYSASAGDVRLAALAVPAASWAGRSDSL